MSDFKEGNSGKNLQTSARLAHQLAACGGEIFRLVMAAEQPEVRTTHIDGVDMRASRAVPGYQGWQAPTKPVDGLLAAYVTALFIGDTDLNDKNLGTVDKGSSLQVVKIDTECAFTDPFFSSDQEEMTRALDKPAATDKGYEMNEDFARNLWQSVSFSESEIRNLLHSPKAVEEKFKAIGTILQLGAGPLHQIVDR